MPRIIKNTLLNYIPQFVDNVLKVKLQFEKMYQVKREFLYVGVETPTYLLSYIAFYYSYVKRKSNENKQINPQKLNNNNYYI